MGAGLGTTRAHLRGEAGSGQEGGAHRGRCRGWAAVAGLVHAGRRPGPHPQQAAHGRRPGRSQAGLLPDALRRVPGHGDGLCRGRGRRRLHPPRRLRHTELAAEPRGLLHHADAVPRLRREGGQRRRPVVAQPDGAADGARPAHAPRAGGWPYRQRRHKSSVARPGGARAGPGGEGPGDDRCLQGGCRPGGPGCTAVRCPAGRSRLDRRKCSRSLWVFSSGSQKRLHRTTGCFMAATPT